MQRRAFIEKQSEYSCLTCTRIDSPKLLEVCGETICHDCDEKWGRGFKDFMRSFSADLYNMVTQSTIVPQFEYSISGISPTHTPVYETNTEWGRPITKSEYLYSPDTDGTLTWGGDIR